jgi:hypothetical protein
VAALIGRSRLVTCDPNPLSERRALFIAPINVGAGTLVTTVPISFRLRHRPSETRVWHREQAVRAVARGRHVFHLGNKEGALGNPWGLYRHASVMR